MSKLDIFFVLYTVWYISYIIIPDTNKVSNDPLNLCGFMGWVGFWLYLACWVGISARNDWWPVTPPVMHRG